MKCAVFTQEDQRALYAFTNQWDTLRDCDWEDSEIKEELDDMPELKRYMGLTPVESQILFLADNFRLIHYIRHLLTAYDTAFSNACDPSADTLKFKPEIAKAIEYFPRAIQILTDVSNGMTMYTEVLDGIKKFLNEVKEKSG